MPYEAFFARLAQEGFAAWVDRLQGPALARLSSQAHGDLPRWQACVAALPTPPADRVVLTAPAIRVDAEPPVPPATRAVLRSALAGLHPWRKGPYRLHGVYLDTEWRSDLKWDRLRGAVAPLTDRSVLDVGCGNGYHGWRMLGAGARLVVGIDPTPVFVQQFLAVGRLIPDPRIAVLPLGIDELPSGVCGFDTVFSMGVLYHRRDPGAHLVRLAGLMRSGGELVLETLVLTGRGERVLRPQGRYARMRNVWHIPTLAALENWLAAAGFTGVRLVHLGATTPAEQRTTEWMRFESLAACLDPRDPTRTIEGHPAPVRALLVMKQS